MNKLLFTTLLSLSSIFVFSQGYNIEVKIKNAKNQDVILGHHFNEQLIPDDTIKLDNRGVGTFKGKKAFPGGMYFVFLPNQKMFDFILDKDQDFSVTADTFNFTETVSFKNSVENVFFSEYHRMVTGVQEKQNELLKKRESFKGDENKIQEINIEITNIVEGMNTYHNKFISENKNLFFAKFLKATRRPEVPKSITDKKEQYYWFRHHYFDNMDVSDARFLRTPIFKNTIETYLDKVLMQHPDTLIPEVDMLIEKSRSNDELFRFMLVYLFNKYASSQIMTAENVFVHIAEKYYIKEAEWSNPEFIEDLKIKVSHRKKCLIGNQAYNINYSLAPVDTLKINSLLIKNEEYKAKALQIEKSEADSIIKYNLKVNLLTEYFRLFEETANLKDFKAKYTILWFWTPSCSHCRKETPLFYKTYIEKEFKEKGVEIISIYMQKDITDWKRYAKDEKDWLEFIKKHELYKWTNCWNPFDRFRVNFDVRSTPVLYLLDQNKKIIAKKITYEQAFDMIEHEMKEK